MDGKARLVRENFCDGFGDCLPNCPTGAISFEEREAPAYDEAAVKAARQEGKNEEKEKIIQTAEPAKRKGAMTAITAQLTAGADHPAGGCPGSRLKLFERKEAVRSEAAEPGYRPVSRLNQWPCQDCTAYAYANMHEDFMKGRITVIGCPKLDAVDYTEKLTAIIRDNDIKGVTIVRMEVPCCGGLQRAAENALKASGKFIPWQVVTISTDGRILD